MSNELYWSKNKSNKVLDQVKDDLHQDEITIDGNGVTINHYSGTTMDELIEILPYITDEVKFWTTSEETARQIKEYIEICKEQHNRLTDKDIVELRSAFGTGTTVINALTGERIHL